MKRWKTADTSTHTKPDCLVSFMYFYQREVMEQLGKFTTWKTELQVPFVPKEVWEMLIDHEDMALWVQYDSDALKEPAGKTVF